MYRLNKLQSTALLGDIIQIYNSTHQAEPVTIEQLLDVIKVIVDYTNQSEGIEVHVGECSCLSLLKDRLINK
ncbi:hypothetical protein EXM36_17130 [Clostridium botulinum]|nr:hypothetical protein [Clostridium botulinum]NFA39640.1 hypothetical protein [Clostridium botulinum]NFA75499.1 hypothetical protein [Clostridium botulinum]NFB50909.1 hypothetical protein [Clostridium botulinum]NFD15736.1 hypothetical protein [Clostridium botulinum]